MKDVQLNPYYIMQKLLDETQNMMFRWRAGRIIKHIDIDLYERTISSVLQLEEQLMVAQSTIEVLTNKLKQNEIVLKHFTPEDLQFLRKRIKKRHDNNIS